MSIEAWLAFVAATAILVVISGPTILTLISYSMSHGKRARLYTVFASSAASLLVKRATS